MVLEIVDGGILLKTELVSFKGVSEGVYIQIKGEDLESIIWWIQA